MCNQLPSDPTSVGGIDLRKLPNLTLVQGDFRDPAGYKQYLVGAYGAFINTDFWSIYAENGGKTAQVIETEIKYGSHAIEAAKAAGVQHFVLSSSYLGSDLVEGMFTPGGLKLNELLRESGMAYTIYYSSAYWENLEHVGMVQTNQDGSISFNLFCPDSVRQQFTSVVTVGLFVRKIFQERDRFLGKEVLNAIETHTWGDIATRLALLSGKTITTPHMSQEAFYSDEMKQTLGMFWPSLDSLYRTSKDVYFPGTTGREVIPDLPSLEEWARKDPFMKKVLDL
ncbi:hypothetical protein P7C73_g3166, partial [Tremellales sp. Uapishka_1]